MQSIECSPTRREGIRATRAQRARKKRRAVKLIRGDSSSGNDSKSQRIDGTKENKGRANGEHGFLGVRVAGKWSRACTVPLSAATRMFAYCARYVHAVSGWINRVIKMELNVN